MSDRQILKVLKPIRGKWGNHMISPNITIALKKRKELFLDYFSVESMSFESKNSNDEFVEEQKSLVYCHDIVGLIEFVHFLRDIDPNTSKNIFSLDGGKGIVKVVLNLWTNDQRCDARSYRKSIVVALVEDA